jgi:hypothetical protein
MAARAALGSNSRSATFVVVAFTAALLSGNTTAAEITQKPGTTCSNSTLTATQFVEALYAIASHGTLLDIPFIERTLHVQFVSKIVTEGGIPNPHRKSYRADSIFGAPISVDLDVNDDREQQLTRHSTGILRVDFGPYADCLQLYPSHLHARLENCLSILHRL